MSKTHCRTVTIPST